MKLAFFVPGVPQPKGSVTRISTGQYLEAGTGRSRKRKALWYARVAVDALRASKGPLKPISTGVTVAVCFKFPIPASRLRGRRKLTPGDPHLGPGDLDKLCRAVGDSLTRSGVIVDDRLITTWYATKVYATQGDEGANIAITW